ncbi:phosphoglycerate mutase family protein [Micromonospora sp. MED01]|uniref:histidine phosphatase family protein n=1 Tax=Micromonospora alfalfae TaxID=2911212 RepID=UPI001EE81FF1|nr:histidine phosphatase family protein [Micromonospora alfalfae]MCG5462894.1 phosphoglycerate mutase family protein [Micromonospora alfalfae]
MTTLWIRHGTSLDGITRPHAHARPDTPLTARGAAQIAATAHTLRDRGARPTIVFTSPHPRATTSAQILAALLGVPLADPNPLYAEWRPPDCVLGKGPDEYPLEYQTWRRDRLRDPDSALAGGESLTALYERAMAAAAVLGPAVEVNDALIVSHRVLIGAVAAIIAGASRPQDVFQAARRFTLAPAGIWPALAELR